MSDSKNIRLLITDVDGVLTDGRIIYAADGRGGVLETKQFNVRDGLGVKLAQKAGIRVSVLTSRASTAVERRCAELGITDVHQGAASKMEESLRILAASGLTFAETCYIGDDLPDLGPMLACAISAAPSDACGDVREAATWRLDSKGGHGAFRELVERLLRERGQWDGLVEEFRTGKPAGQSI